MTEPVSNAIVNDAIWRVRVTWLILLLGLVRLIVAISLPVDLGHDETYYWEWSRRPDWGYASKPPMVAWVIGISTWAFGNTPFAVRLPAVVFGTGMLPWIYLLTTDMYGRRAGFWAVVLAATMPGLTAVSLLASIDGPLLFCWAATLFTFWRFVEHGAKSSGWILATAVFAGVGLLSKQTMFAFFPLAGIFLLARSESRQQLGRPILWAGATVSCAMAAPFLVWNIRHGWLTLHHTAAHFAGAHATIVQRLVGLGEFLGGALGLLSPITGLLAFYLFVVAAASFQKLTRKEVFLLCFGGVPLVPVLLLALKQPVEANWPAPFFLAAIPLIAGGCLGKTPLRLPPRIRPRNLVTASIVGAIFIAILGWIITDPRVHGRRIDIAARLRGWKDLASAVDAVRLSSPQPDRTFVIVIGSRILASELAFYLPGHPRVYLWEAEDGPRSQYSIWGGPQDKQGYDALVVMNPGPHPPPPAICSAFRRIEDRGVARVPVGNGRQHAHRLWLGSHFVEWPSRRD